MFNHTAKEKALLTVTIFGVFFLIMEVVASIMTKSLALISDASHILTDVSILIVTLLALKIAKKPVDVKKTFGYHRVEVLATALNTILLFLVSIYIIIEAYIRFFNPEEIYSPALLVIACLGICYNFYAMRILFPIQAENISIKSAYIEVLSDMLSSVGVLIAGLLILFYDLYWADSAIAIAIGVWILPRSFSLFKESIDILLESVPKHINITNVKEKIQATPGVIEVTSLHIWSINQEKICLIASLTINNPEKHNQILEAIEVLLNKEYNIHLSTIQMKHQIQIQQ